MLLKILYIFLVELLTKLKKIKQLKLKGIQIIFLKKNLNFLHPTNLKTPSNLSKGTNISGSLS